MVVRNVTISHYLVTNRLRKAGDDKCRAPLEIQEHSLFHMVLFSIYTPFSTSPRVFTLVEDGADLHRVIDLRTYGPCAGYMVSLSALRCYRARANRIVRSALLLGILYLAFQAFPIIFGEVHGFNTQSVGLSFLGIGLGMMIALASQPFWNRLFAQQAKSLKGDPPPEVRLIPGQVGGILAPIGQSPAYSVHRTFFRHVIRTLHHGFHDVQASALDRAYHRLNTVRSGNGVHFHRRVHVSRHCLSTNCGERDGS